MEIISKFLDTVLLLLMYVMLALCLPAYMVFELLSFIKRSSFPESVAGKVILITGASSGIGQEVALEYARRGARLALVARREDRLQEVADKARKLGSSDVIVVGADVSKINECRRFIYETINHFGQLDHFVSNAGILQTNTFDDYNQHLSDLAPVMDINFWGSVYGAKFAVPFLRKSSGRIAVIASCAAYTPTPKLSFYCASKAALVSFFETLRIELMPDIGITIVTPGFIKTDMIRDKNLSEIMRVNFFTALSTEVCARAIVDSICRGDMYLTEPSWVTTLFWFKSFLPVTFEWFQHYLFMKRPGGLNKGA